MKHGPIPTCCPLAAVSSCVGPVVALPGPQHSRQGSAGLCQGMGTSEPRSPCPGDSMVHPPWLLRHPSCTPRGKRKVASAWWRPAQSHPAVCWPCSHGSRPAELRARYQPDTPAAAITAFVFNRVESGNPASPFCINKRDLLSRGPALCIGLMKLPPLSSLIFIAELSRETGLSSFPASHTECVSLPPQQCWLYQGGGRRARGWSPSQHRNGSGFPLVVLMACPNPTAGPTGQLCLQGKRDECHGAAVTQAWLEELSLNQWKAISDFHPIPFPTNSSWKICHQFKPFKMFISKYLWRGQKGVLEFLPAWLQLAKKPHSNFLRLQQQIIRGLKRRFPVEHAWWQPSPAPQTWPTAAEGFSSLWLSRHRTSSRAPATTASAEDWCLDAALKSEAESGLGASPAEGAASALHSWCTDSWKTERKGNFFL